MTDEQTPVRPRPIRTPRRRSARRVVPNPHHPRRTLAILVALVIGSIFVSYDVSGIAKMQKEPVTGVDYLPVVSFVQERRLAGEKVLVALPPPAYLAFGSTNDLIFLSSPIDRKRAQRYTRLTEDGGYVDYWTGVDSVVDTASLCQTLLNEPGLWLIVDESRLNADWAYKGAMATVIRGMTYVRYEVEGGAMVRRLSPPPSRTVEAEQICAAAQTGRINDADVTVDEFSEPNVAPTSAP
jgi:hypothetical protein